MSKQNKSLDIDIITSLVALIGFTVAIIIFYIILPNLTDVDSVITAGVHDNIVLQDGKLTTKLSDSTTQTIDTPFIEVELLSYKDKLYEKSNDINVSYAETTIQSVEVISKNKLLPKYQNEDLYLVKHASSIDDIKNADKVVKNLKEFSTETYIKANYWRVRK